MQSESRCVCPSWRSPHRGLPLKEGDRWPDRRRALWRGTPVILAPAAGHLEGTVGQESGAASSPRAAGPTRLSCSPAGRNFSPSGTGWGHSQTGPCLGCSRNHSDGSRRPVPSPDLAGSLSLCLSRLWRCGPVTGHLGHRTAAVPGQPDTRPPLPEASVDVRGQDLHRPLARPRMPGTGKQRGLRGQQGGQGPEMGRFVNSVVNNLEHRPRFIQVWPENSQPMSPSEPCHLSKAHLTSLLPAHWQPPGRGSNRGSSCWVSEPTCPPPQLSSEQERRTFRVDPRQGRPSKELGSAHKGAPSHLPSLSAGSEPRPVPGSVRRSQALESSLTQSLTLNLGILLRDALRLGPLLFPLKAAGHLRSTGVSRQRPPPHPPQAWAWTTLQWQGQLSTRPSADAQ
uniref:uncharacterized protein LOC120884008 n=1 Tax=Ictidomys tridecemlineatus TaxID=43179 RepID=UPI001A9EA48F|nr:uncharacterized protein LOC120884008 [Ictidomys tridecemlineatus]